MNEEKLTLDPCHKCGEHRIGHGMLLTHLHPGTAFVICERCKHQGPQVLPRGDMSKLEDRKKVLKAIADAWNAEQRSYRKEAVETSRCVEPPH